MASTITNSLRCPIYCMSGNGINGESFEWHQIDLDYERFVKPKRKKDLNEALVKPEDIYPKNEPQHEATDFIENRMKDLKGKIDQINKEINLRFEMKNQFDEQMEYQLSRATFSLGQFKFWGLGYNTGVDVKRNMLEKQLVDFRKEKRRTELQCWEDIISLRKELRAVIEEYKMLARRRESMV
jgi:hypothetical protein